MGSSTATNTISGTSMATPHIAGIVAYYLSQGISASEIPSYLQTYGQTGLVVDAAGSPDLIGNNGYWVS